MRVPDNFIINFKKGSSMTIGKMSRKHFKEIKLLLTWSPNCIVTNSTGEGAIKITHKAARSNSH